MIKCSLQDYKLYMRTRVCILQKNDMSSYGFDNVESVPWFAVDAIDGTIYKVGVFNDIM